MNIGYVASKEDRNKRDYFVEKPVSEKEDKIREPLPIAIDEILIITKHSKVEYDMLQQGISLSELKDVYRSEGVDFDKVFLSHQRQLEALSQLQDIFGAEHIIKLDGADSDYTDQIKRAHLIVSFGGDNHFQRVSHLINGSTPILGINSDPKSSFGALLYYNTDKFIEELADLEKGEYLFEPWTRISVEIGGKFIGLATCDVFLGEERRQMMSRYRLNLLDQSAEHKSSGLIVSTGAGSGGWFNSAIRPFFPEGLKFPKTDPVLKFVSSEVSVTGNMNMPYGSVEDGVPLLVESLNDDHGILSLDSLETFAFSRGMRAKLFVNKDPLWVIHP